MHSTGFRPKILSIFNITCLAIIAFCFTKGNSQATQDHFPQVTLTSPDYPEDEIVTNLYVWRHGETNSNHAKVISGGGDTTASLTEKGRQQAHELANKILHLGLQLQAIYSSDLLRATSTAEPVLAAFSETIQAITPAPQLREILHGKYERIPGEERGRQAELMFQRELDKMELCNESIRNQIEEGTLDRFHFSRIHSISGRVAKKKGTIIDVVAYLRDNHQEPETPYELYHRVHAEFIKIAEETQHLGFSEVGISTHAAVLATLIDVAQYSQKHCFIPVHYQSEPLQSKGEVVMPVGMKIENCALAHFRYWHKSKQLQFCGMLD